MSSTITATNSVTAYNTKATTSVMSTYHHRYHLFNCLQHNR
jgi:hypothetical protein